MAFSAGTSTQYSDINVTPLIDVLLVLLIIFMVIIPAIPRGLDSRLPQPGKQPAAAPETAPLVLEVLTPAAAAQPARLRINAQDVPPDQLSSRLSALLAQRSDRTLFVSADRGLPFDSVARAVATAKQAGAAPIALMGTDTPKR